MLGMVFAVPLTFGFVVWRSYRTAAERLARGEMTHTPDTIRWDGEVGAPETDA